MNKRASGLLFEACPRNMTSEVYIIFTAYFDDPIWNIEVIF